MEFVARVLVQIPDPRRHLVRYYGAYSNASRGKRKKAAAPAEPSSPHEASWDSRRRRTRLVADWQQLRPPGRGVARKSLKRWCALHDSNVRPTDS